MKKWVKRTLLAGAIMAGPALINNAIFSRAKALGNPLGGEGRFWSWREGDLFHTSAGNGEPIVLLHGIYAGASIYEWRKNFEPLAKNFTVTAVDWLGFGLSDKPNIRYSSDIYVEQLSDFLREVIRRPCTVVASSLGAAYAIEAAAAMPDVVRKLILVCPAGFKTPADCASGPVNEAKRRIVTAPLIGTSLYDVIASRAFLRAYLQNEVFFDPSYVTDEMIDHFSTASHQYGSQYAPLSFVAGDLDRSVSGTFPTLTQESIRIVWGREAKTSPLSNAEPFLSANGSAQLTVLDKSGLLPHDEQASAFNRLVEEIAGAPNDGGEPKPKRRPRSKPTVSDEPPSPETGA